MPSRLSGFMMFSTTASVAAASSWSVKSSAIVARILVDVFLDDGPHEREPAQRQACLNVDEARFLARGEDVVRDKPARGDRHAVTDDAARGRHQKLFEIVIQHLTAPGRSRRGQHLTSAGVGEG